MAETVKSGGKCWNEGVEVSCPKEKTQARKMTSDKKPSVRREDRLMKAMEAEKNRRKKFGWGK